MFYGNIETHEDAISYAEELYHNAVAERSRRLNEALDAVDVWMATRKGKGRARSLWHKYLNAKSNAHYMKGYLQGVRDMMDALK